LLEGDPAPSADLAGNRRPCISQRAGNTENARPPISERQQTELLTRFEARGCRALLSRAVPEQEVEVEVLDLTEDETRVLLLSLDPLATLAQTQEVLHARLMECTPVDCPELQTLWQARVSACIDTPEARDRPAAELPEQYLVLITCRDERQQTELLARFQGEGLECRALLS
jgi:hypothetical protein